MPDPPVAAGSGVPAAPSQVAGVSAVGDHTAEPSRGGFPQENTSILSENHDVWSFKAAGSASEGEKARPVGGGAVGGGGGAVSWHVLPRPNPFSHLPAARTSCPVERERIMLIWLRRSPKLRNLTVDLWLDARDPIIGMHAVLLGSRVTQKWTVRAHRAARNCGRSTGVEKYEDQGEFVAERIVAERIFRHRRFNWRE